jgi:NAD+ diphosphatase
MPDLPDPAHHDLDSMLSRKFGREIANYFSGSPLNRVSFLRHNHEFISKALTHPTTSFLLFNDLAPMARDPSSLAYATHAEIKPLIGENPFEKTEEELIQQYNSSITLPLVLFLGVDERKKEGFEHGIYKGKPYFAIDVTPKGTIEKEATNIIEAAKAKGLQFLEGRVHMSLNAPEGKSSTLITRVAIDKLPSCYLCSSKSAN